MEINTATKFYKYWLLLTTNIIIIIVVFTVTMTAIYVLNYSSWQQWTLLGDTLHIFGQYRYFVTWGAALLS